MSLPELLDAARKLTRGEKLRLMHELLDEVAGGDLRGEYSPLPTRTPIISPILAPEAAAALADLLSTGGTS
jgi:hypothetical protein